MLAGVADFVRIWHSAITTNLWGLGCPIYCTSPALGTFIAFLLIGFIAGTAFGAWATYYFLAGLQPGQVVDPVPEAPSVLVRRRTRLAGYAHG